MLRNLFTVGSTCFQARCDDCVVVVEMARAAHEGTAKHSLFVARFVLKVSLFLQKNSFLVFLSFFQHATRKKQQYVPIVNLSLLSCAFALIININLTACEIRAAYCVRIPPFLIRLSGRESLFQPSSPQIDKSHTHPHVKLLFLMLQV